jgi:hypothetical protein
MSNNKRTGNDQRSDVKNRNNEAYWLDKANTEKQLAERDSRIKENKEVKPPIQKDKE